MARIDSASVFRSDIEEDDKNYSYELEYQWLSPDEMEQKRKQCLPGSQKAQRELDQEPILRPKVEPKIKPSQPIQEKKISKVNVTNQQIKFPEAQEPKQTIKRLTRVRNHQYIMDLKMRKGVC